MYTWQACARLFDSWMDGVCSSETSFKWISKWTLVRHDDVVCELSSSFGIVLTSNCVTPIIVYVIYAKINEKSLQITLRKCLLKWQLTSRELSWDNGMTNTFRDHHSCVRILYHCEIASCSFSALDTISRLNTLIVLNPNRMSNRMKTILGLYRLHHPGNK